MIFDGLLTRTGRPQISTGIRSEAVLQDGCTRSFSSDKAKSSVIAEITSSVSGYTQHAARQNYFYTPDRVFNYFVSTTKIHEFTVLQ